MNPAVFPRDVKNNSGSVKCCETAAAKLTLTQPELMLQVHAKHMHEPSAGGELGE